MDGTKGRQSHFYRTTKFKKTKNMIDLQNGIKFYKQDGYVEMGGRKLKVNNFVETQYDSKGKLKTKIQSINTEGQVNVIYMKNYHTFLVLNDKLFNSTYIQLFVLENYNQKLFEPIILTPRSKVYKLKI